MSAIPAGTVLTVQVSGYWEDWHSIFGLNEDILGEVKAALASDTFTINQASITQPGMLDQLASGQLLGSAYVATLTVTTNVDDDDGAIASRIGGAFGSVTGNPPSSTSVTEAPASAALPVADPTAQGTGAATSIASSIGSTLSSAASAVQSDLWLVLALIAVILIVAIVFIGPGVKVNA